MPTINVTSEPVKITLSPAEAKVTLAPAGVPGPPGPQGPQGIPGASGSGYIFEQAVPAATWIINHPLLRLPNIAVYIAGEEVLTDVVADDTTATITFPSPFAGYAVLV